MLEMPWQKRFPGKGGEGRFTEATCRLQGNLGADARNRTADPFITSEVLCQLSYVGPGEA